MTPEKSPDEKLQEIGHAAILEFSKGRCIMDIGSIAGSSLLMKSAQTQQNLSMSAMKQAADQQNQMANLLAQSAQQAPQPVGDAKGGFSTFA